MENYVLWPDLLGACQGSKDFCCRVCWGLSVVSSKPSSLEVPVFFQEMRTMVGMGFSYSCVIYQEGAVSVWGKMWALGRCGKP